MAKPDDTNEPQRKPRIAGIIFGMGNFTPDPEDAVAAAVDFGPGFDEMFGNAVRGARELKEEIVVNGPEDLPTMVTAVGPHGALMLPVQEMLDSSGMRPPDAIGACLAISGAMFGPPIGVVLLLETLFVKIDEEEYRPPLRTGELSERWNAGDRDGVAEAIVVTAATADRYVSEFLPYHYGDGGVVWDEGSRTELDDWPDIEPTGNVERAVMVAFRQQEEGGSDGAQRL